MSEAEVCVTPELPNTTGFLEDIPTGDFILVETGGVLLSIIVSLGFVQLAYAFKYINDDKIRGKVYSLISLYPCVAALNFLSMLSPRSASILQSVVVLAILLQMYNVISLGRYLCGNLQQMSSDLTSTDTPINFQSPPVCCCMCCLPTTSASTNKLRILEALVFQAPLVRIILIIVNIWLIADNGAPASEPYLFVTDIAGVPSLLCALFCGHTMARLLSNHLSAHRFIVLFRFVDAALALCTAQLPIIFEGILNKFGVWSCGPQLSVLGNAKFVYNFVVLVQLMLLSLLATYMITPSKSALFDLYGERRAAINGRSALNGNDLIDSDKRS